jgi:predicted Zn-dependent protease
MNRRYCFSCGTALPREAGPVGAAWRPAGLCARCAQSGPQIAVERVRYEVRGEDGAVRGPLSLDAVVDQLQRKVLSPGSRVARVGAAHVHAYALPELANHFIPGTREQAALDKGRAAEASARRSGALRRGGRAAAVGLAASAAIGLAAWGWMNDLFVVPEAATAAIEAEAAALFATAQEKVELAFGDPAARVGPRAVPGEALLAQLTTAWPSPQGHAVLHLAEARVLMWQGTTTAMGQARVRLEQAAVLSPEDGEVWASLAEVYATLSERELELGARAAQAADRADALIDGPSVLRAQAAVAMAAGDRSRAADIATPCGEPPSAAVDLSKGVDPTCAYFVAAALGRDRELAALARAYPDNFRIQLARAESELHAGRPLDAAELAGKLARAHPKESAPWGVLLDAHVAVGAWGDARQAGERLRALSPQDLRRRVLLANVLLKAEGQAQAALTELDEIIKLDAFAAYAERAQVFADAAAAAAALKRHEQALAYADRGLAVSGAHPAATLHKAIALAQLGKHADAELTLRGADLTGLSSGDSGRFHVGAAALHLRGGRERLAESELSQALEADPSSAHARLVKAWARAVLKDGEGAVRHIEEAAFLDLSADRVRSPLRAVWLPRLDYSELLRALDAELGADLRFDKRLAGARGIVAAVNGQAEARGLLEKGAGAGIDGAWSRAALAQVYLERGMPGPARSTAAAIKHRGGDPAIGLGVQARAASQLKDPAEARSLFAQALDRDPQLAVLHRWRGEHLASAGEKADAARELKEALRLAPDDMAAQRALVELERAR